MSIGRRIKELRMRKALSQEELAFKAKVNLKTLIDAERGLRAPRMLTLRKIANALDIEPRFFTASEMSSRSRQEHPPAEHLAEPLRWPEAICWCRNEQLATLYAAKLFFNRISSIAKPSIVFPTGRTAASFFRAIDRCLCDYPNTTLFKGNCFIDTETYGVSKQHPSSRHRFVLSALEALTKGTSHNFQNENLHFFDGTFSTGSELERYDSLLRDNPPDIHIVALSPNGELVGYEPGNNYNIHELEHQRCCIINLSELAKTYIEPKQPSRAIISIGLNHVLHASHLLLLIIHVNKAGALRRILAGPIDPMYPATLLRMHPHTTVVAITAIAEVIDAKPKNVIECEADILKNMVGARR